MNIERSCFVIMPFGEKDADGRRVDFDRVYRELIRESVHGRNKASPGYTIRCTRSDEIDRAGWIHRKMIRHIHESDLAIVDLSSLNPNVFYELGVRHALVPAGTLLIRRDGTELPFNITGFNTIAYPSFRSPAQVQDFRERLRRFAANALTLGGVDSLVHETIRVEIRSDSAPIGACNRYERVLRAAPGKRVGLVTGDLVNVGGVDAWVNSENTDMQMDRYNGGSISSVIRYYGARKDDADHVVEDVIGDELRKQMGDRVSVGAGSVVVTGSGELEARNGVKRILHAAAVVGQVRVGFRPIQGLGSCVGRVLEKAASLSDVPIRSVLFPLMGTGTARGALERRAREIIGAAVDHFVNHPDSAVDAVYFLAWKQDELRTCLQVLDQDVRLARPGAGAAKRGARRATRKKAARKKTARKKTARKNVPRKKTLRKAVRKKTARKKRPRR